MVQHQARRGGVQPRESPADQALGPLRGRAPTTPITLLVTLTAQQQREFTACAKTCGLDLAAWVVQCAAVQAAAVIDALQAPQRHSRAKVLAANEPANARNRERRRVREHDEHDEHDETPTELDTRNEAPDARDEVPARDAAAAKGSTLAAARTYNARFRARSKDP
jgi:hypothetical protein